MSTIVGRHSNKFRVYWYMVLVIEGLMIHKWNIYAFMKTRFMQEKQNSLGKQIWVVED